MGREGKKELIEMKLQSHTTNNILYKTSELKLAALLLTQIPSCSIKVYEQGDSIRKTIEIKYSVEYKDIANKLERDFIDKRAIANVYAYNKALNLIRDRLRGLNERIDGRNGDNRMDKTASEA